MNLQPHNVRTVKHYSYAQEDLLGKGATGEVYLGVDTQIGRKVAFKVIKMAEINNQVTRYLLDNEKRALSTLKHPNIVQALDIVQQRDHCYMITEYCNGGTLQELIKKNGKLNENEALRIFKSIIEGYRQCAEAGIVHRDLKPANILMSNGVPKISDFGYCECRGIPKPKMYYNVGSPSYMAPEAYVSNMYSEKSDIWALGILLFEMITGKTLDQGKKLMESIHQINKQGIPFPEGITNHLKAIIKDCLNLDPNRRIVADALLNKLNNPNPQDLVVQSGNCNNAYGIQLQPNQTIIMAPVSSIPGHPQPSNNPMQMAAFRHSQPQLPGQLHQPVAIPSMNQIPSQQNISPFQINAPLQNAPKNQVAHSPQARMRPVSSRDVFFNHQQKMKSEPSENIFLHRNSGQEALLRRPPSQHSNIGQLFQSKHQQPATINANQQVTGQQKLLLTRSVHMGGAPDLTNVPNQNHAQSMKIGLETRQKMAKSQILDFVPPMERPGDINKYVPYPTTQHLSLPNKLSQTPVSQNIPIMQFRNSYNPNPNQSKSMGVNNNVVNIQSFQNQQQHMFEPNFKKRQMIPTQNLDNLKQQQQTQQLFNPQLFGRQNQPFQIDTSFQQNNQMNLFMIPSKTPGSLNLIPQQQQADQQRRIPKFQQQVPKFSNERNMRNPLVIDAGLIVPR